MSSLLINRLYHEAVGGTVICPRAVSLVINKNKIITKEWNDYGNS